MKKILLYVALISLSLNIANAKPLICPFSDYFQIEAPGGYNITSLYSEGNVQAVLTNLNSFTTHCASNTSKESGFVYVTVADRNTYCVLEILDGPYEFNPVVSNYRCDGNLLYAGVDHKWGTYTYTLKFIEN